VSVCILSRRLCESDLNIAIDRFYQIYYDVHIPAGFSSFPAHNVWFVVAFVQYSSRCLSYSSRVLPLVNTLYDHYILSGHRIVYVAPHHAGFYVYFLHRRRDKAAPGLSCPSQFFIFHLSFI